MAQVEQATFVCPKCNQPLTEIRYPSDSMLNRDQWESQIPGDLFCICHNNHKGNKPYAYFWKEDLRKVAAHAPSVTPPPRGEKRPIARPCSACGDGDTEMKYHDHFPPFADELGAPSVAEAPAPTKVIASIDTIICEARGLIKVMCRAIWAKEHGLRMGRDDVSDGSAYVMRLAWALGLLPEINGSKFTEFCEELTGLEWKSPEVGRYLCDACADHHSERCDTPETCNAIRAESAPALSESEETLRNRFLESALEEARKEARMREERAKEGWISVKESGNPAENGEYLVSSPSGVETADYYLGSMSWETVRTYGIDSESRTIYDVEWWRPLPTAPVTEKK